MIALIPRASVVRTDYAAAESERAGLWIRFVSVLPQLTPEQVDKAVIEIATAEQPDHRAYKLTAAGLSPLA